MKMNTKIWMPVVMIMAMIFYSCSEQSEQKKQTARYVKTFTVHPGSAIKETVFNGVVNEQREVTLSFKVAGPVNQLLVDDGDYVEKGQVIARIDKRDYKVNLDVATAQYNQAKSEYERYQELYDRDKLPANTLDKIKAGYLMAKSQYENAKNALEDTDLKAPFSGYIHQKLIENFETVSAGRPIVKLIDVSSLDVTISVPEAMVNQMEKVNKITCDIKNAHQENIPASIKTISKKSGLDRLFEVKINITPNNRTTVKPGMVAVVNVQYQPKGDSNTQVPVEAVFAQGSKSYVWVVDKNTNEVSKQEVSVGKLLGSGMIEIVSGITTGNVVVTAGVHSLVENQQVKLMPKKSATNIGELL